MSGGGVSNAPNAEGKERELQQIVFSRGEAKYDEEFVRTGISCDRLRQQLKRCIKASDCVQVHRKKARECYEEMELPEQCRLIMYAFSECKRNTIDPRSRFRGRKGDI